MFSLLVNRTHVLGLI